MTAHLGMVGLCCNTGVGVANQDFYEHLPFARRLVVPQYMHGVDYARLDDRCLVGSQTMDVRSLEQWLTGLDTVFAIQQGYVRNLWSVAKGLGIKTVLMPNAEFFKPADLEMESVDLFIAPTLACAQMLEDTGFGNRTAYVPHVIDVERFRFRHRDRADVFIHCRGDGGPYTGALPPEAGGDYVERKGTDIVLEAARRCPEVEFLIRYQSPLDADWPGNVRLLGPVAEPHEQYDLGDVAIQPSRWEGVGLQILEAMSCGIPAIVSDAPPMNEYPSDKRLCISVHSNPVTIQKKPWTAWEMDIDSLVKAVKNLHGQRISDLSDSARAQMEKRSWARLRAEYLRLLGFD
jgi:glycosyltransferase involved in cell wall biosynthesis